MNKQRKKEIAKIIKGIEDIKSSLEKVLDEEQDVFDNIPENLQCSMRAEESEEAIDYMTEAVGSLNEIIDQLENI